MDLPSIALRVVTSVLPIVGRKVIGNATRKRIESQASSALTSDIADSEFVDRLRPKQAQRLEVFLKSPQFGHLVLQAVLYALAGHDEERYVAFRSQLRESLRHTQAFTESDLFEATNALDGLIRRTVDAVCAMPDTKVTDEHLAAMAAHSATAAARNSQLLERVSTLSKFENFAVRLRSTVQVLHGKLQLPTVVRSQSVNYSTLYVQPSLKDDDLGVIREPGLLISQRLRTVILGDPGAGKSTLASKLAHDLATNNVGGVVGQVPIVLVVREHTTALRSEHQTLLHYLEASCRQPYGLVPPVNCLEYLLFNGLATVIIDGVDELGASHFRVTFSRMVNAFAKLYPLARIIVTSRIVGYDEAPLDEDMFATAYVAPFTDQQVGGYAQRWFSLETDLPQQRRAILSRSFMQESAESKDLRSNPLMLSLLCALYASEGYIPRNRPAVYERCSELLFNTWDKSRGIEVQHQFRAYVRPAVQHLAWWLFTDPDGRQAIPRSQMEQFLADSVLSKRYDDVNDAIQAAHDFLLFCAGRAWVLTDMGSDKTEPHYGFVHRTFLEYFAAAQLVKRDPHPKQVWEQIRKHLEDATWNVVSQLAVQVLEKDCDDGGDSLLKLALSNFEEQPPVAPLRVRLLAFAAGSADNFPPHNDTIKQLTEKSLELSCVPAKDRRGLTKNDVLIDSSWIDIPLARLLSLRASETVGRVGRSLAPLLYDRAVELPETSSAGLIFNIVNEKASKVAQACRDSLRGKMPPAAALFWKSALYAPTRATIEAQGFSGLYTWTAAGTEIVPPYADRLIRQGFLAIGAGMKSLEFLAELERLYRELEDVEIDLSFSLRLKRGDWSSIASALTLGHVEKIKNPSARAAFVLLLLPLLRPDWQEDYGDMSMTMLALSRTEQSPVRALKLVERWALPDAVGTIVNEWMARRVRVARTGDLVFVDLPS